MKPKDVTHEQIVNGLLYHKAAIEKLNLWVQVLLGIQVITIAAEWVEYL